MFNDCKILSKMDVGYKHYFLKILPYLFFLLLEFFDGKLTLKVIQYKS